MLRSLYERVAIVMTGNLRVADPTEVLADKRLTAALLDQLTHETHVLEFVGYSYRCCEPMQRKS